MTTMSVPLDQLLVSVSDITALRHEQIPALHPSRTEDVQFVLYQPPPVATANVDEATVAEYRERLTFIRDDLHWLLTLPHDRFWCQVIFEESVHRCLDSYLRFAPRSFDVVCDLPDDVRTIHNQVHRLVFMTCLRMATYKESKKHFITPEEFGKIIYENYIFDVPKMMDLCVLYGAGNGPLLTKMINNIFTQQPQYADDLEATVPTIMEVFDLLLEKCGLTTNPAAPPTLGSGRQPRPLVTMETGKLQDLAFYISDTAHTLWAFLEVYPVGAKAFSGHDFPARLASLCETVFPALSEAIKEHDWASNSHRDLVKVKVMSAHACLLKVFRQIVNQAALEPLFDGACTTDAAEVYTEAYLDLMASVLGERRFMANLEYLYPFREDRDILSQSPYPVDETRLQFIQDAVNEAYSMFGKRKVWARDSQGLEAPGKEAVTEVDSSGAIDSHLQQDEVSDQAGVGASAKSITGVELESLITSVKDLLPDLGDGFIQQCLEECDYKVESVINMVLEDKLPASLRGLSRHMPRETSNFEAPVKEDPPILMERRNVYNNDEFDVFSRDQVDTSRIHMGKKDRLGASTAAVLDDKTAVDNLRPMYDRYGSEFVESMYDKVSDYEDEYDDTYDSHVVGAADADSADELTARRPFTLPRVLMGGHQPKDIEEESAEETEEARPPRDHFIEDPAKIRQRQEERRATLAAQRGRQAGRHRGRGKGQGQEQQQGQGQDQQQGQGQGDREPKKYDVKGKPKGQGQSADVLKNRAYKERNKSSRVHHNRRALADKKRQA